MSGWRQRDFFDEYPFYDGDPPSQRHSRTSRAAAGSIKPRIGPLHRRILDFLDRRGSLGATDEEMQQVLDMAANTQRPRRRELQLAGRVEDSGAERLTKAARRAVVWISNGGQHDQERSQSVER